MILKVKDKLRGNEELIINLLHELGIENTKPLNTKREIRWGGNNGSKLNIDTLYYNSYSHNQKGDILVMVSYLKGIELGETIKWLSKYLNIEYTYTKTDIVLPFGGFFKNYSKSKELDETPPITYPMNRLEEFNNGLSLMWVKDGISLLVQEEFNIGYDFITNRITIPWLDSCGNLIGIMGRLHSNEIKEYQNKYMPIIAFNKSKALYGYYQNYKSILDKGKIIICESEKSVLQAREYGYSNVVALGGNNISKIHERLIKSMYCDCILCLDEGIELKYCIEQANKLKIINPFFSNEVYILDMSELPKKSCIFDLDKKTINKAFEERLIYIGE